MSFTARYHRKALPKKSHEDFQALPKATRQTVERLAALLRLAEGLDRSHFQNVRHVDIRLDADALQLRLTTESDPQIDVWGTHRASDLFEHVYGRRVEVEVEA